MHAAQHCLMTKQLTHLSLAELDAVTGGIDWKHAAQQGLVHGGKGFAYGVPSGGVVGLAAGILNDTVRGPLAAMGAGAMLAAGAGAVGGFVYGAGKGAIETWDK
jgi:hypothetical protein